MCTSAECAESSVAQSAECRVCSSAERVKCAPVYQSNQCPEYRVLSLYQCLPVPRVLSAELPSAECAPECVPKHIVQCSESAVSSVGKCPECRVQSVECVQCVPE